MMRKEFKDDILDYLRGVVARYDKPVKSKDKP